MESVQAIYASTSGNVEMTVEAVAEGWRQTGVEVFLHRSEIVPPEIISDNRLFLFAASTWEHGEFNPYFAPIFEKISTTDCSGKTAFFVGCGDYRYEPVKFNMGIQKIMDTWVAQGGQAIFHPLKINGDPQLAMEKVIQPWIQESLPHLKTVAGGNNA